MDGAAGGPKQYLIAVIPEGVMGGEREAEEAAGEN